MQLDKRDVETSLEKKGFEPSETHHRYFTYRTVAGKLSNIKTYTSRSGKTLDGYLLTQMAKQTKLKRSEFVDLVRCPLSREGYEAILVEKGEVDPPETGPDVGADGPRGPEAPR